MDKESILVSVIAPIYNVEKFISRAIESIQEQTHVNFELIIVIDGSPDDSAQIADKYSREDRRIRVIRKENGGVSSARNVGMEAARGEFVCFIDPDDYVEPDYIDYMLNLAVDNGADIALTTKLSGTFKNKKQVKRDSAKILSPEEATAEILYYHIPIGCVCKLFRREFLNEHKIRFLEDFAIGEGFNFNTTAFQHANRVVAGQRKIYFYYRENATSAMTKFDINKSKNGLLAIENIRKNLLIKSKKLYRAVDFADYHTHTNFYQWMHTADVTKQYPEMYSTYRNTARRKAINAFLCPVGRDEKTRALLVLIAPTLLAKAWTYMRKK